MKRALVCFGLLLFAVLVYASEQPIGALVSADGGSVNNLQNGQWSDGGVSDFALPNFPSVTVLSVQCTLPACLIATTVGDSGVAICAQGTANSGVSLPSGMPLFDIAVGKSINSIAMVPVAANTDGGVVSCQLWAPSL